MIQYLKAALKNKIRVIVVTRPIEDFKEKDRVALRRTLDLLKNDGIRVVFKPNIQIQSF